MTKARIRLAQSLYAVADLFESDMDRHRGQWRPGSPADRETAKEPWAGAWGATPASDAHVSVLLHVHAAAENLRATGLALEHSNAVLPLFTLARTVLDQSCYPWYQLEPGIGIDERIKRHKNAELRSEHEKLQMLAVLQGAGPQAVQEAERRIQAILQCAALQGWITKPKGGPAGSPYIHTGVDQGKPPSTTKLTDEILPRNGLGLMVWRLGSAIAHGHSYGLASLLKTDGEGKAMVVQSDLDTARRLSPALLAYLELLQRLYIDFGWSRSGYERLKEQVGQLWAEIGEITPPPPIPATFRR